MPAQRKLTESRAWALIARRIASGAWGRKGLCHEIDRLDNQDVISDTTRRLMERRIGNHLSVTPCSCSNPYCRQGAVWLDTPGEKGSRVIAAQLLAYEARAERQ